MNHAGACARRGARSLPLSWCLDNFQFHLAQGRAYLIMSQNELVDNRYSIEYNHS